MQLGGYAIVAAICVVVIGAYLYVLAHGKKVREAFFRRAGFASPTGGNDKDIAKRLTIKSKGARSVPFGSKVYMASGVNGDLVVCDLIVSVGVARYAGFSKITVLAFIGGIDEKPDFLLRKPYPMETRWELRGARPLSGGWHAWCTGGCRDDFDEVARRADAFGNSAILRKRGSFLSVYFRNQYLGEKEIETLLPEWRAFCQSFVEADD